MNADDFKAMAIRVTESLGGKTISHATSQDWGAAYSLTLHFTDGTSAEIHPEYDEGFDLNITDARRVVPPTGAGEPECDHELRTAGSGSVRVIF